ncbi:hypothetical protein HW44_10130 [Nitrosococcus oceani]|nr:hypothetical protein HW44_10130 [Nitrosococcus oceani]
MPIEYKSIDKSGKECPGWIEDSNKQTEILAYHKQATGKTYYFTWEAIQGMWWWIKQDTSEIYKQSSCDSGWGRTYTYQVPASDIEDLSKALLGVENS